MAHVLPRPVKKREEKGVKSGRLIINHDSGDHSTAIGNFVGVKMERASSKESAATTNAKDFFPLPENFASTAIYPVGCTVLHCANVSAAAPSSTSGTADGDSSSTNKNQRLRCISGNVTQVGMDLEAKNRDNLYKINFAEKEKILKESDLQFAPMTLVWMNGKDLVEACPQNGQPKKEEFHAIVLSTTHGLGGDQPPPLRYVIKLMDDDDDRRVYFNIKPKSLRFRCIEKANVKEERGPSPLQATSAVFETSADEEANIAASMALDKPITAPRRVSQTSTVETSSNTPSVAVESTPSAPLRISQTSTVEASSNTPSTTVKKTPSAPRRLSHPSVEASSNTPSMAALNKPSAPRRVSQTSSVETSSNTSSRTLENMPSAHRKNSLNASSHATTPPAKENTVEAQREQPKRVPSSTESKGGHERMDCSTELAQQEQQSHCLRHPSASSATGPICSPTNSLESSDASRRETEPSQQQNRELHHPSASRAIGPICSPTNSTESPIISMRETTDGNEGHNPPTKTNDDIPQGVIHNFQPNPFKDIAVTTKHNFRDALVELRKVFGVDSAKQLLRSRVGHRPCLLYHLTGFCVKNETCPCKDSHRDLTPKESKDLEETFRQLTSSEGPIMTNSVTVPRKRRVSFVSAHEPEPGATVEALGTYESLEVCGSIPAKRQKFEIGCALHGTCNHTTEECKTLYDIKQRMPEKRHSVDADVYQCALHGECSHTTKECKTIQQYKHDLEQFGTPLVPDGALRNLQPHAFRNITRRKHRLKVAYEKLVHHYGDESRVWEIIYQSYCLPFHLTGYCRDNINCRKASSHRDLTVQATMRLENVLRPAMSPGGPIYAKSRNRSLDAAGIPGTATENHQPNPFRLIRITNRHDFGYAMYWLNSQGYCRKETWSTSVLGRFCLHYHLAGYCSKMCKRCRRNPGHRLSPEEAHAIEEALLPVSSLGGPIITEKATSDATQEAKRSPDPTTPPSIANAHRDQPAGHPQSPRVCSDIPEDTAVKDVIRSWLKYKS